jgi:hypothetical protein
VVVCVEGSPHGENKDDRPFSHDRIVPIGSEIDKVRRHVLGNRGFRSGLDFFFIGPLSFFIGGDGDGRQVGEIFKDEQPLGALMNAISTR